MLRTIKMLTKLIFIFLLIFIWFFSGWLGIWKKPIIVLSQENEVKERIEDQNIPEAEDIEIFELTEKEIKGIEEIRGFSDKLILKVKKEDKNEIWLFDLKDEKWQKLNPKELISHDSPIAIKDNYVFWLSEDKKTILAYDWIKNEYYQKEIPLFDPSQGKRAEINFSKIPWKVIFDGESFYFWSKKTGEIFPDGDSLVLETFKEKFNLDKFLTSEKLGELGFLVETNE